VFNVVRSESLVQVAVSEGAVLFEPDGEKQTLKPGMALSKAAGRPAQVARVETDAVGAWREGRLVYSAAAVSQVASDLSRNLGVMVAAADGAGSRPFSGVIMLDGSDAEVLGRAAALLGLRARR
jgi:transmembrane sensor